MVPDPYRALNLPHTATDEQIKRSYRELARRYHPDRLAAICRQRGSDAVVSEAEKAEATAKFAKISAAYDLLSDAQRKARYDHVYRYGGYDDVCDDDDDGYHEFAPRNRKVQQASSTETGPSPPSPAAAVNQQMHYHHRHQHQQHGGGGGSGSNHNSNSRKRRTSSRGVGYACVDPLAFLWTNGRVQSQMAVAGIQIPSRLGMMMSSSRSGGGGNSGSGGGFRFAFSSGHFTTSPTTGTKQYKTQTTQYCHGKKYTRTETTTVYPDGRREVVIEGKDYYERRFVSPPSSETGGGVDGVTHQPPTTTNVNNEPWYANAWHEVKNKLAMCHNPCMVTQ